MAAAEGESFARAADRLNIVRPAFSRHILQLEAELGISLFDRTGRTVKLSSAGKVYAREVKEVLARLDAANAEMRAMSLDSALSVRIGLLDFIGLEERVVDALSAFHAAHPRSELTVKPMSSIDQIREIRLGLIDAGFIYSCGSAAPDLEHLNVLDDRWQVALPLHHPLARQDDVSITDLFDEEFVMVTPEVAPTPHRELMDACLARGFLPRIVQYAPNSNALFTLIASGIGIGFMTGLADPPARVAVRPLRDLDLRLPLDFVWRADSERKGHAVAIDTIIRSLKAA